MPEWKEGCDLSKLAWPLMEVAKTLEEKEGPGDVKVHYFVQVCFCFLLSVLDTNTQISLLFQIQLIELEDSVFQTLAAFSESDG